jgi:hypothetical protein
MFRKQKDKLLSPAASKTDPSRHNRKRSSLSNFVSQILPSQRPEKGYTLRNEFKNGGPLAASDLVFGIFESQRPVSDEGSRDVQSASGTHNRNAYNQDYISTSHNKGIRNETLEARSKSAGVQESLGQTAEDGRAKAKKGLVRLFGLKTGPSRDKEMQLRGCSASQEQQSIGHFPPLHFENDALELNFHQPTAAKEEEEEVSRTQQIFEAKKARRDQRRSLVASGDFLGVQGANPRTGYWDVSTATTSSEPSQMSSGTRKNLEQQAKAVEEQKMKYEEAQARYSEGLARIHSLNDSREAEKIRQKKLRVRSKQRMQGRWDAGENGWSSVAEPDLSPIRQSLVGSPTTGQWDTSNAPLQTAPVTTSFFCS